MSRWAELQPPVDEDTTSQWMWLHRIPGFPTPEKWERPKKMSAWEAALGGFVRFMQSFGFMQSENI